MPTALPGLRQPGLALAPRHRAVRPAGPSHSSHIIWGSHDSPERAEDSHQRAGWGFRQTWHPERQFSPP